LWTSVVADTCSQQILGQIQIGGRDAHRLSDLTVTQLFVLVAWIESFCEKIEDASPDIVVGKVVKHSRRWTAAPSNWSILASC
jgi:hypothetical protein